MITTTALFLLKAIGISLSGVMAPGAVTAAAIAGGTRSRHAGAWIAIGHGIVEFPLMILIMAGMGVIFESEAVRIGIGLAGGSFLIFMGVQMLRAHARHDEPSAVVAGRHPVWLGVILSGGNPYFLLWWATVGLGLATQAMNLGPTAFALFAVVHWSCDLVWLELLSLASFKGGRLLNERRQRIVLLICALALILFGLLFWWGAGKMWLFTAAT